MKHLHKITISNARRFAKDVEITFGAGATIILAPNGTGKTTVFEAIEFALTGTIQRLVHPPFSLIRDRQSGMDVRLDFEDGKFCEVKYVKGKEPVLKGHHDLLYPKNQKEEVSHLLRLTHLLEQKGTNWFVQQSDSSNAGSILDKLSLGKELQGIFNSKKATLTAATQVVGDAEDEVVSAKAELAAFEELLQAKNEAKHNYTLRSLEELKDELKLVNRLIRGTLKSVSGSKLESVVGYVSKLDSDAETRLKFLSGSVIRLSGFEKKVSSYGKLKTDIAAKDEMLRSKKDSISQLDAEIVRIRTVILKQTKILNEDRDRLGILNEINTWLVSQNNETKSVAELEVSLLQRQINLDDLARKAKVAADEFDKAKEVRSKKDFFAETEKKLVARQSELNGLQRELGEWQQRESTLKTLETVDLPKVVSQKPEVEKILDDWKLELTKLEVSYNKNSQQLASLKNVEDAILGAVATISANLNQNENHCPVCNTEFAPAELRSRMDIAMKNVSPLLAETAERVKEDEERLTTIGQKIGSARDELNKTEQAIRDLEDRIGQMRRSIEGYYQKFPGCKMSHEGVTWQRTQLASVNLEIERNQKDNEALGGEISDTHLNSLQLVRDRAADEVQTGTRNVQIMRDKLNEARQKLAELTAKLKDRNAVAIAPSIEQLNAEIKKVEDDLRSVKRTLEQVELKKEEANKDIMRETNLLSELESQLAKTLAEWKDMDLEGEPTKEKFEARKLMLQNESSDCKKGTVTLGEIKSELNKWKKAEKFEMLDQKVRLLVRKSTEALHLAGLKAKVREQRDIVTTLKEKRTTLNDLYSRIGNQINSVHEQLVSINPLWVSLLKKVVLNPRFLDTELSSYAWRNRPHAEVKVKLHNELVRVMDVASEAQATDLQLTFLLSMATTYEWTPWKALLLDDPTQHHDLVHASGVFDLLRKYILAQDFQVLLGTHDSVQARFFQRKLQNDGIPVNVWNLIADENGVKAEKI